MKLYKWHFFKTKNGAKNFQKKHGGVFYSNAKYSHTKSDYMVTTFMAGKDDEFRQKYPYVVCWNKSV